MADFHKKTSPYANTPVKDFYLDLAVYRDLVAQDDDKYITIEPQYHLRPDKLAHELYKTPNLFWVFWMRNKDVIIDPINDFTSGTKIYVQTNQYITDTLL